MRETTAARRQRLAYEKTLYQYSTALEGGDLDSIISILHTAENDAHLEQLIIETHMEGYQQEGPLLQQTNPSSQTKLHSLEASIPDLSQQPISLLGAFRTRRRFRNRFIVLQSAVAVLIASALLLSILFIFPLYNTVRVHHQRRVDLGRQAMTPTGEIIVTQSVDDAGRGVLTALNADTHTPIWHYALGSDIDHNVAVGLVVRDHVVYVAYHKQVAALRVSNGTLLWKTILGTADQTTDLDSNPPQLVVDHGLIYASGYVSGNLYTLKMATGTLLWRYEASVPALLTVNNGIAYVLTTGDDNNAIKALNGVNGRVLWQYATSRPFHAVVSDNVLYVQAANLQINDPTSSHKERKPLFALNAITGTRLWSTIASATGPSQLVIEQGVLILFDGNHFCGYRISNGSQAWCTVGPTHDFNGEGIISVQGIVYGIYSTNFTTNVLDAINPRNGTLYWSQIIGVPASGNPRIVALGESLILPRNGLVINRTNGDVLWYLSTTLIDAAVGS